MITHRAIHLSDADREFAQAIHRINAANPFLPERIEAERAALGEDFRADGAAWNTRPPTPTSHPNVVRITERCAAWLDRVQIQGVAKAVPKPADLRLYEEVAGYWLYQTYAPLFDAVIRASLDGHGEGGRVLFYPRFKEDVRRHFHPLAQAWASVRGERGAALDEAHLFACAFQIRRAFHNIFSSLVGSSKPMVALRASLWQSLFTHDLGRYRRVLYSRMGDFATLITGPSGTGKELVARALALSRYIPYEPRRGGFQYDFARGYFALNLAALSPTLIESELFGHRRGAFTGALANRAGWMEVCPPTGAVFLDEIGETESNIQVKLLRVLQARTFQPLGTTDSLPFTGKIIAATHRDLPSEIRNGRFREDFYYRLCSDQITTPTLRSQLDDAPDDLERALDHIATRAVGAAEAPPFVEKASEWIKRNLGNTYPWPGNFRELEQCVRNLLLRGEYRPTHALHAEAGSWRARLDVGALSTEELLSHYTRLVYERSGTYEETARRLGVDRRTVRARLVPSG